MTVRGRADGAHPGRLRAALRRAVPWRERPERVVALLLLVLLVATSSRYGWHRDELYFLEAGRHPAWGYPDQPLLTPLMVAGAAAIGNGSIVAVRVVSALAAAATTLLVGGIARDMSRDSEGGRRASLIAASVWAAGALSLVTGHFVDTTTFDVLATAGCCRCLVRAVRDGNPRWVAAAGLVAGVGFLNKLLVGMLVAAAVLGILAVGPRRVFRSRWTVIGLAAAALGAAPYVIWQGLHGWPQITVAHAIAADGAEGGQAGVVPFQFLLVSPALAPIWIAGLVRLLRNPAARPYRGFALAYPLVLVLVIAGHGKAYYAAGLLPVLVAAGGIATDGWLRRAGGRRRGRARLLGAALTLSLVIDACIGLAVLPVRALTPGGVMALNPDAGEQVGWPAFTREIATAWRMIPPSERASAVIFTGNYGEAGAVDEYGRPLGLPDAYSGHNAFGLWGPPPDRSGPVVVVGYAATDLAPSFRECRVVTTIDNGVGLENDEQGDPVFLCAGTQRPWSQLWPTLLHDD